MFREASPLRSVVGIVGRPRPAPELGLPIVAERLLDLGVGVHHERPVSSHRFADRSSLQHHDLGTGGAGGEGEVGSRVDERPGARPERDRPRTVVSPDDELVTFEEVQNSLGRRIVNRLQYERCVGLQHEMPDRHLGVLVRRPRIGRLDR